MNTIVLPFIKAMNDFPQELFDQICGYLSCAQPLRTAYYASAKFRKAVEEHAGKYRDCTWYMDEKNADSREREREREYCQLLYRVSTFFCHPSCLCWSSRPARHILPWLRDKFELLLRQTHVCLIDGFLSHPYPLLCPLGSSKLLVFLLEQVCVCNLRPV